MRLTRAAQRAQQDVDEPSTDAAEAMERSPLHEISANASPEQIAPVEEAPMKTPARSKSKKGGKKGAKGKKGRAAEVEPAQEELEDESPAEELPASDVVVENIIVAPLEGEQRETCTCGCH
jgi:hypothetical protein